MIIVCRLAQSDMECVSLISYAKYAPQLTLEEDARNKPSDGVQLKYTSIAVEDWESLLTQPVSQTIIVCVVALSVLGPIHWHGISCPSSHNPHNCANDNISSYSFSTISRLEDVLLHIYVYSHWFFA